MYQEIYPNGKLNENIDPEEVRIGQAINWILFMWLLALVQISVSNITYSIGDVYMLVKNLNVCTILSLVI